MRTEVYRRDEVTRGDAFSHAIENTSRDTEFVQIHLKITGRQAEASCIPLASTCRTHFIVDILDMDSGVKPGDASCSDALGTKASIAPRV